METVEFEDKQKGAFLEAMKKTPHEYSAARIAKVPIALVRGWYDSDPDFNLACECIREEMVDAVEAKLFENALEGDTQSIKMVLENHRPKYNPRRDGDEDKGPTKHRIMDFSGEVIGGDPEEPIDAEFEEVK